MLKRNQIVDAIQSALAEGATSTASLLLNHLKDAEDKALAVKPNKASPAVTHQTAVQLVVEKPAEYARPGEIYSYVCAYLRAQLEPGESFYFHNVADYLQSRPELLGRLDRYYNKAERREKWRNHVSASLEKLKALKFIAKGQKNTEYRLIDWP